MALRQEGRILQQSMIVAWRFERTRTGAIGRAVDVYISHELNAWTKITLLARPASGLPGLRLTTLISITCTPVLDVNEDSSPAEVSVCRTMRNYAFKRYMSLPAPRRSVPDNLSALTLHKLPNGRR